MEGDMETKTTEELLLSLRYIHQGVTLSDEQGFVPVGDIAHQAADKIEALMNANKEKEKEIARLDSLLREAFPIKP